MGVCASKPKLATTEQLNIIPARVPPPPPPGTGDSGDVHAQLNDDDETRMPPEVLDAKNVELRMKSHHIYDTCDYDGNVVAYDVYAEMAHRMSTDDPYDAYIMQEDYDDSNGTVPPSNRSELGRAFMLEAKGDDVDGAPRVASDAPNDGSDVALWNQQYQRALDMPEDTPENERAKYEVLNKLSLDFVQLAILYGRTIISELYFKNRDERTITNRFGGKAGGEKFVVHGIVFKLAKDCELSNNQWLYGGLKPNTEFASKSMSLELKGSLHYSSSMNEVKTLDPSLCTVRVPMQVLVDYRGFRLMVMPLLPLAPNSLIYGSSDGAVTVQDRDEAFSATMKACAQLMHLQGHIVGSGVEARMLYAAGDVEGHVGTDGRYYMLDFARAFPPESFGDCPHLIPNPQSIFIRMLRPELLRHLKDYKMSPPLSPDALCRWGANDQDFQQHCEHVREATKYLLDSIIPTFAEWLDHTIDIASPAEVAQFNLALQMHSRGINMRHLGLIRKHTRKNGGASLLLLQEMVKRTLKNILREWLRAETREQRPSSNKVFRLVAGFCNLVSMSKGDVARRFWSEMVVSGVLSRFGRIALTDEEQRENMLAEIVSQHDPLVYLQYCMQVCGMVLSPRCTEELHTLRTAQGFQFTAVDIQDGPLRVKHMSFLDYVQGKHLVNQAELLEESAPRVAARLLRLSVERFSAGLNMEPRNVLLRKRVALSVSKQHELEDGWQQRGVNKRQAADEALLSFIDEVVNDAAWNDYISSVIEEVFVSLFSMWERRRQHSSNTIYSHYAGGASTQRVLRRAQRLLERYHGRSRTTICTTEIRVAWQYRNATSLVFWDFLRHMAQTLDIHELADVLQYVRPSGSNTDDRAKRRSFVAEQGSNSYSRHLIRVASQPSLARGLDMDTGPVDPQFVYGDRSSALARQLRDTPGVLREISKLVKRSAQRHHGFLLAFLQEMGIDINQLDSATDQQGTMAMVAAVTGDERVLTALIQAGVELEVVDDHGDTALHLSIAKRDVNAVSLLLAANTTLGGRNKDGETPLMVAVRTDDTTMVDMLVRNGAELENIDGRGRTVLHTCATKGFADVARVLVQAGANLQARDHHHATPLHLAAIKGHVEVMKVLVDSGRLDLAALADYDRIAVYLAAEQNQLEVVRYLLSVQPSSVETRDALGGTPLWVAAASGCVEIVNALVDEYNANVDQPAHDGTTPLWIAASRGYVFCVSVLLDADADIDHCDVLKRTVLIGASSHGHANVVSELLSREENYPSLEEKDGKELGERTALVAAAMEGFTDTVVVLLDAGANLEATNAFNQTSLGVASMMGHEETVRVLLDRKANVAQRDDNGETALLLAAFAGHTSTCAVLIEHGAQCSVKNRSGQSALHLASLNGHVDTIRVLVENDAIVNDADSTGATALQNAAGGGHSLAVECLLELKADVDSRDENHVTPLYQAVYNSQARTAEVLIQNGANVGARHIVGWTPLWIAAYKGYVDVMFVLLRKTQEIDVDASWKGMTPLFAASQQGHKDGVKLLLESGSDVSITNEEGKLPVDVAREREHASVVACFTSAAATDSEVNIERPNGDRALSVPQELGELGTHFHHRSSVARHTRTGSMYRQQSTHQASTLYALDTAMVWSCTNGDIGLTQFLLSAGGDVNAENNRQASCLWIACNEEKNMDMIELLLRSNADVNACDVDSVSIVSEAAANGQVDLVRLLLSHGAVPGIRNNEEETALSRAAANGHASVVRLLHEVGANLEFKHKLGETPLMRSVKGGHVEATVTLLELNANVNCTDDAGHTPLIVAVQKNDVELVRVLLDVGHADRSIRSNADESALDVAAKLYESDSKDAIMELMSAAETS